MIITVCFMSQHPQHLLLARLEDASKAGCAIGVSMSAADVAGGSSSIIVDHLQLLLVAEHVRGAYLLFQEVESNN